MDGSYETYVYSIVRFVPNPMSGERVNMAVIVGNDETGEWSMETVPLPTRAKHITKDSGFADKAHREIERLEERLEKYMVGESDFPGPHSPSSEWLRYLHDEKRNSITFTAPTTTLATSVEDAVEDLYSDYIVEPPRRDVGGPNVASARKSVRDAYRAEGLEAHEDYNEHVFVHFTDESEDFGRTFDFGVMNGRTQQLVQAWNFSKKDQEELITDVDAWAWWISQIRQENTVAIFDGHEAELPTDVDFNVVGIPPSDDRPSHAWEKAQMLAEQLRVRFVPRGQAERIAQAAKQRLQNGQVNSN